MSWKEPGEPRGNPGLHGSGVTLTGVTGAGGGGGGAGTRRAGFGRGGLVAAVEARLTLLAVGALGVAFTVQTHSCTQEKRHGQCTSSGPARNTTRDPKVPPQCGFCVLYVFARQTAFRDI